MKKSELKQIIKEEVQKVMNEAGFDVQKVAANHMGNVTSQLSQLQRIVSPEGWDVIMYWMNSGRALAGNKLAILDRLVDSIKNPMTQGELASWVNNSAAKDLVRLTQTGDLVLNPTTKRYSLKK
jgi:hypothetical protein